MRISGEGQIGIALGLLGLGGGGASVIWPVAGYGMMAAAAVGFVVLGGYHVTEARRYRPSKTAALPVAAEQGKTAQCRWLISSARQIIAQTSQENGDDWVFRKRLESSPEYWELRPYLSPKYVAYTKAHETGRFGIMPHDGQMLPPLADMFAEEIDRLEKEWGLDRL